MGVETRFTRIITPLHGYCCSRNARSLLLGPPLVTSPLIFSLFSTLGDIAPLVCLLYILLLIFVRGDKPSNLYGRDEACGLIMGAFKNG